MAMKLEGGCQCQNSLRCLEKNHLILPCVIPGTSLLDQPRNIAVCPMDCNMPGAIYKTLSKKLQLASKREMTPCCWTKKWKVCDQSTHQRAGKARANELGERLTEQLERVYFERWACAAWNNTGVVFLHSAPDSRSLLDS